MKPIVVVAVPLRESVVSLGMLLLIRALPEEEVVKPERGLLLGVLV